MTKNYELRIALGKVLADAKQQAQRFENELQNPRTDWWLEKHGKKIQEDLDHARIVEHWCFIRMMQIDPD
jgi:hypothetical protein